MLDDLDDQFDSISKELVRSTMENVDALDLPDGAHWAMIHERLGLEYGDVFDIIAGDPEFFGYEFEKTGS